MGPDLNGNRPRQKKEQSSCSGDDHSTQKKVKSSATKTAQRSDGAQKFGSTRKKGQKTQKESSKGIGSQRAGILSPFFEIDPFLSTDPRKFDYEKEFVRRFRNGRESVSRNNGAMGKLFGPKYIVKPDPAWPPMQNKGLKFEMVRTYDDGTLILYLKYTRAYALDQISFLHSTEMGDFVSNMLLLHGSPYHLCSLLQASDILRSENKIDMADEFLKRSIYAVQFALPSSINVFSGKITMPYSHYENRAFHIALLKIIDLTVSKGCWDAAMEFSKFLLSLDPNEDPLAVLSIIDYYAVRSKQMGWYLDLIASDDYFPLMDELPNNMYSVALSHYELHLISKKTMQQQPNSAGDYHLKESNALLRKAILKYPSAVYELKRYCKWNNPKIEGPKFNRDDVDHRSKVFIALFAKHSHTMWKIPEIYSWLTKNIDAVFDDIPLPDKNFDNGEPDDIDTSSLVPLYRRILVSTEDPYLRGLIPKKYVSGTINLLDPIPSPFDGHIPFGIP